MHIQGIFLQTRKTTGFSEAIRQLNLAGVTDLSNPRNLTTTNYTQAKIRIRRRCCKRVRGPRRSLRRIASGSLSLHGTRHPLKLPEHAWQLLHHAMLGILGSAVGLEKIIGRGEVGHFADWQAAQLAEPSAGEATAPRAPTERTK